MDEIIKQFKLDFKNSFGVEIPTSHLLSFIIHELDERKRSMIKDQLLGRTTNDLIAICTLLEGVVNQSLSRQLEPTDQDIRNAIQAVNKHDKKNKKH